MKVNGRFSTHPSQSPERSRSELDTINEHPGIPVGQSLPPGGLQSVFDTGSTVSQQSSQISNSGSSSLSQEITASTPQSSSASSEISRCATHHGDLFQQNQPLPENATLHDSAAHRMAAGASVQNFEHKQRHPPARHCTYEQLNCRQRIALFLTLALCGFLATASSIGKLDALPIRKRGHNWTVIGDSEISYAGSIYLLCLGLGALIWGPAGDFCGRKWPQIVAAFLFSVFNVAVACSPNYHLYMFLRCFVAVQSACFFIIGSSCIGDIYPEKELPSAIGWFFLSTFSGSCLGRPILAAMVGPHRGGDYPRAKWSRFFWFQAGLGLFATIALYFFMPETVQPKRYKHFLRLPWSAKLHVLWTFMNPARVLSLYMFPNILIVSLACGVLVFDSYTILTGTLTQMAQEGPASGIMYLMIFFPAVGAAIGILIADKWDDLNLWIFSRFYDRKERQSTNQCCERETAQQLDAESQPDAEVQTSAERRLASSLIPLGLVSPVCTLLFATSIQFRFGGDALRIVVAFFQGLAQALCVPSLTTYSMEITRTRCAEALAASHLMRYLFASISTISTARGFDKPNLSQYGAISSSLLLIMALLI